MAANKKRKGLGSLGIDILLSSPAKVASKAEEPLQATSASMADQLSIAIDLVDRSPFQPRQTITDEGLQELADSIRSQGLIQPIVVRKTADRYELIAGERRWRAAQIAGLQDIPAVIKQADDQAAAAMALIENLQRENLNPVEEAVAIANLIAQFNWTHQEVAEVLGKARATVSNSLRLLELADNARQMVNDRLLSMGHARALLSLPLEQQNTIAKEIAAKQLSVRQTEQLVKKLLAQSGKKTKPSTLEKDPNIQALENRLADRLGAAVGIRSNEKTGKGKIEIPFNSLDELDGILNKLNNG
jgi:ParB family chromosome partitioning protein